MSVNLTGLVPSSSQQVLDCVWLVVGGWFGWLVHPLVPLVAGPFRWAAFLLGTAAQESGFNAANTSGDGGQSWGMLQFYAATWEGVTNGRDPDLRLSPFWSGYYAAKYTQQALLASWRWWIIAAPGIGFVAMRWLWTNGAAASSAESLWTGNDTYSSAIEQVREEGHGWASFMLWRSVSLIPAGITAYAFWKVWRRRRAF